MPAYIVFHMKRLVLCLWLLFVAIPLHAQTTAQETFAQGGAGQGLPTIKVSEGTIGIVTALTVLGFAGSNGEARRKIAEGAVRLNDIAIKDERYEIVLDQDAPVKLSLGKKRHGLLERG